jgi:hypothetical protein
LPLHIFPSDFFRVENFLIGRINLHLKLIDQRLYFVLNKLFQLHLNKNYFLNHIFEVVHDFRSLQSLLDEIKILQNLSQSLLIDVDLTETESSIFDFQKVQRI